MPFSKRLLASQGLICVAEAREAGGYNHYFFGEFDEAQQKIDQLNDRGSTVFLAQATFDKEKIAAANEHNRNLPRDHKKEDRAGKRTHANAMLMRNFFFDIDCGPDKDYPDQPAGLRALGKFIQDTGLPIPAVVNSGNGLYAHWLLTDDVPVENWKVVAQLLKKVSVAYEFKTDPARTSDTASVLRPPGTTNRKRGESKPVYLLQAMNKPLSFAAFAEIVKKAAAAKKVPTTSLSKPMAATDPNADFYSGTEMQSIPSSAVAIAEKCSQLRKLRDTKGDLSEPLWYAGLGVLVFCEDGDDLIHQWSDGHIDYDFDRTEQKVAHRRDSGTGPTTCAHYGDTDPSGCLGCAHANKIKSPIVLGRPEPEAIVLEAEECGPPAHFRRSPEGLMYDEEGVWKKFYDHDLYPSRVSHDESLGYQVVTLRHYLQHEGWMECTIRSSMIGDGKTLTQTLWDNHVIVGGAKEKKIMAAYLESYVAKLQRQRAMSQLFCQMGWKDLPTGPAFVLGQNIYLASGAVESAPLAKNVPAIAASFCSKGSVAEWAAMTEVLDSEEACPLAFALLAGGFGAPLIKFTGFNGAMLSMVGDSGVGKTLTLCMIQSVYGKHKDLMLLRDDTKNMLVSRLGVHGTTPVTLDEVTNIDGMDLSDLVYRITQGRDKGRLTKDSTERKTLNHWATLAVVTTNSSLVDKLSGAKHDAAAEINRVFEYNVPRTDALDTKGATQAYWTIDENYGVAGDLYARWLVTNHAKIKPGIDKVREIIDRNAEVMGEERFWSMIAATAIYGGMVALKLGLIKFDVARVMKWATATIREMRVCRTSLSTDAISVIGQFLDEKAPNTITVLNNYKGGKDCEPLEVPRGALEVRREADTGMVYFPRNIIRQWLTKRYGNYTKVKQELEACGALKNVDRRKILGSGTRYRGAQQVCWELDLNCRALGYTGLLLIEADKEKIAKAARLAANLG